MVSEIRALRAEVAGMRAENNKGHATTADRAGKGRDVLDTVARNGGGSAFAVEQAA